MELTRECPRMIVAGRDFGVFMLRASWEDVDMPLIKSVVYLWVLNQNFEKCLKN